MTFSCDTCGPLHITCDYYKDTMHYHCKVCGKSWREPPLPPSITEIMTDKLLDGQTVYVGYSNPEGLEHWYPDTSLKLVPNPDGTYERYWRNTANTDWVQGIPLDNKQDPTDFGDCYTELFESEEQAIEHVRKLNETN